MQFYFCIVAYFSKRILYFLVFALNISSGEVKGGEKASVYGLGVVRCHDFIDSSREDMLHKLKFYTWAQGFLSALNLHNRYEFTLTPENFSIPDQMKAIDSYCTMNPEDLYYNAVIYVYVQILEIQ